MSDQLSSTQVSGDEPTQLITVFGAVAAGATALVTALALIPGVPPWAFGVVGAVAAVCTAITGYLTKRSVTRQTTPWQDVAAKVTPHGKIISGPADTERPTGALVALVDATASSSFQPGESVYPPAGPDYPNEGDPL